MPRPGPRRPLVAIKLDQDGIDWIDQRAGDEEVNRSEMIRRMLAYAQQHMPTRYPEETMITVAELTAILGLRTSAQERVARFAGAFRAASDYTKIGRIAPRWAGQGLAATFTLNEAEELENEWRRAATDADRIEYFSPGDAEAEEIAARYRA